MLVRLALAIAQLLAGGLLGAMACVWWAGRRESVELPDAAATEDRARERPLMEMYLRTQAVVGRSLNAHTSLQARLVAATARSSTHTRSSGWMRPGSRPARCGQTPTGPAGALARPATPGCARGVAGA